MSLLRLAGTDVAGTEEVFILFGQLPFDGWSWAFFNRLGLRSRLVFVLSVHRLPPGGSY